MTTARFLSLFGDSFTFQTFDDSSHKSPALSRILHGNLGEHAATLAGLNERGAGVFFMVNAGDGKGRKAANVQRVRALFTDLDGSPLAPVEAAALPPHCIVESSPGRWHAYWLLCDCPLDWFKPLQQAMAERFAADRKVCDLPRVMRLPGFDHCKGEPFTARIVTLDADRAPYTLAELVKGFDLNPAPLPLPARKRRTLPDEINEGERSDTLLSLAAGLVRKGHAGQAVNDRLQRINAERCQPPLCASEVDSITVRAVGYGSDGFVKLPHKLLDSPVWRALKPATQTLIITAFRRFDGFNNGSIAITPTDFDGLPGMTPSAFKRHRRYALASGILLRANEGRNTQRGRKPDLFAIADCWLPTFAEYQKEPLRRVSKRTSYIDEQLLGVEGSREGQRGERRDDQSRAA